MQAYTALLQSYHELNSNHVEQLARQPSPLEFMRYVSRNRPFVVRNAATSWPAVKKWNMAYLKEKMGHQVVDIAVTPNGNADAPIRQVTGDIAASWIFVQPAETQQPFTEFLDELGKKKKKQADNKPVIYAQSQNDNLRSEYLSLFEDVLPDIDWARIALQQDPDAINIWIGNDQSVTSLHKDNYENIYVQIIGQKHFVLIPPIEGPCVHEIMMPQGRYEWLAEKQQFVLRNIPNTEQIPVAVWDPDLPEEKTTRYSGLSRPFRLTLNPGDMLYLPSMWYHKVSQTCGFEGICVAVNYWYDMDFEGSFHSTTTFVREVMAEIA